MIKGIVIAGAGSLFTLFCFFTVYGAFAERMAARYSTYVVKPYDRKDVLFEIARESLPSSIIVFGTPFFIFAYLYIACRAAFKMQTTKRSFALFFAVIGLQVAVCIWGILSFIL